MLVKGVPGALNTLYNADEMSHLFLMINLMNSSVYLYLIIPSKRSLKP